MALVCTRCKAPFVRPGPAGRAPLCSRCKALPPAPKIRPPRIMSPKRCSVCRLEGHTAPTCHVRARGAVHPDEADTVAQRLVPAHTNEVSLADVRRDVAAFLRERLGEAAE